MKNLRLTQYHLSGLQGQVISLQGQFTSLDAIKMKETLLRAVRSVNAPLTIDLTKIEGMDLAGLNALIVATMTRRRLGAPMRITASRNLCVAERISLEKFDRILPVTYVSA